MIHYLCGRNPQKGRDKMSQTNRNLLTLSKAKDTSRPVRFVYNTASKGELVARVGNVVKVTGTHVQLYDSFRNGVRTCILGNIVGNVEAG